MNERKVLGRGLSSLIPTSSIGMVPLPANTGEMEGRPLLVSVEEIRVNPRQPRRRFSETAIEELSQSIRQMGVLSPLLVRNTGAGYELIAGERRLRAAKMAGVQKVPVIIRSTNDLDQLEVALVENLQRQDLNPVEEANGYQKLVTDFSLTQEQIAARVGKERSTISNLLRLLKLSPVVQEMIATGVLSMGHARALLPLEDYRRQETIAQKIEKEGLSVRQVENLIRSMTNPPAQKGRRAADQTGKDPNVRHLADELQRSLGTRVEIISQGKSGEIRIHYYALEDLKRLVDRIIT